MISPSTDPVAAAGFLLVVSGAILSLFLLAYFVLTAVPAWTKRAVRLVHHRRRGSPPARVYRV